MHNFQRIYQLHHILAARSQPVSHKNLEQLLECSHATVTRTINALRDYFNAPLEYDRERNGYYYDAKESDVFELPGVWFDAHELCALLTAQQLLEQIQLGLLGAQPRPIKSVFPHVRRDKSESESVVADSPQSHTIVTPGLTVGRGLKQPTHSKSVNLR